MPRGEFNLKLYSKCVIQFYTFVSGFCLAYTQVSCAWATFRQLSHYIYYLEELSFIYLHSSTLTWAHDMICSKRKPIKYPPTTSFPGRSIPSSFGRGERIRKNCLVDGYVRGGGSIQPICLSPSHCSQGRSEGGERPATQKLCPSVVGRAAAKTTITDREVYSTAGGYLGTQPQCHMQQLAPKGSRPHQRLQCT